MKLHRGGLSAFYREEPQFDTAVVECQLDEFVAAIVSEGIVTWDDVAEILGGDRCGACVGFRRSSRSPAVSNCALDAVDAAQRRAEFVGGILCCSSALEAAMPEDAVAGGAFAPAPEGAEVLAIMGHVTVGVTLTSYRPQVCCFVWKLFGRNAAKADWRAGSGLVVRDLAELVVRDPSELVVRDPAELVGRDPCDRDGAIALTRSRGGFVPDRSEIPGLGKLISNVMVTVLAPVIWAKIFRAWSCVAGCIVGGVILLRWFAVLASRLQFGCIWWAAAAVAAAAGSRPESRCFEFLWACFCGTVPLSGFSRGREELQSFATAAAGAESEFLVGAVLALEWFLAVYQRVTVDMQRFRRRGDLGWVGGPRGWQDSRCCSGGPWGRGVSSDVRRRLPLKRGAIVVPGRLSHLVSSHLVSISVDGLFGYLLTETSETPGLMESSQYIHKPSPAGSWRAICTSTNYWGIADTVHYCSPSDDSACDIHVDRLVSVT